MNKIRRKQLDRLASKLETCFKSLEEIRLGEFNAYDRMNEGMRRSERGAESFNAVENLELATADLRSSISAIREATP